MIVNFNEIIDRLKLITQVKDDHEVASLLGLTKTAFSERKRRGSVPNDKLSLFCERESINMEWIHTGKDWAYIPSTTSQATVWIMKQVNANTKRILIVTYEDNKFGTPNGFVLEKEKGSISMSGAVTRSGYAGSGPNAYRDILVVMKAKGIPVDQVKLTAAEIENSEMIDISSLLLSPKITKNIIDKELSELRPDFYQGEFAVTGRLSSTSEDGEFMYATTMGTWDSSHVENITGLTQNELTSRVPGGPCEPLTLEEAEQIIKKRKPERPGPRKTAENEKAGQIKGESKDTANIGDADLSEIIQLLRKYPENKNLVLKLLKGKQKVKEAIEGLSDK
jgi:hypothetical protein